MKVLQLFALVLPLSASSAWADMYDDCSQDSDQDLRIRACTQVIERDRGTDAQYVSHINRGIAYVVKGDDDNDRQQFKRAIADFNKAIALNANADAYGYRCAAHRHNGDYDDAITDCTRAIELDPSQSLSYMNRVMSYDAKRDARHAIYDFQKVLALDPENFVAKAMMQEYRKLLERARSGEAAGPSH